MDEPWLRGSMVRLAPRVDEHMEELRRIRSTPEVARWWDEPEPDWTAGSDPDDLHWTVLLDDRVIGLVDASEETEPMYRHAGIDLFLDPTVHGRGLGTDVVRTVARWLVTERGHHRVVIDPAAANAVAIATYTKVGFKPVGVMRRYEHDPGGEEFHDGLLMDLLADELR